MARGQQSTPWVYEATDNDGLALRITVAFNNATRALSSAVVHRDVNCRYARIYVGTGPDGTPDTTSRVFSVPAGDTSFTAAQMGLIGLNTIEDFLALQITAGP